MAEATPTPPVTASEPPSQKSFCTSTMISASLIAGPRSAARPVRRAAPLRSWAASDHGHRDGGVARRQLQPFPGYRDQALPQVFPAVHKGRQVGDGFAAPDEGTLQPAVAR